MEEECRDGKEVGEREVICPHSFPFLEYFNNISVANDNSKAKDTTDSQLVVVLTPPFLFSPM